MDWIDWTQEELSLKRMRHAFRASENLIALMSGFVLWPLFLGLLLVIVFIAKAISRGELAAVLFATVVLAAAVLAGAGLWLLLFRFFTSASQTAAVVSLFLFWYFLNVFQTRLTNAATSSGSQSNTIEGTFAIVLAFFFFIHGARLILLHRYDRKSVNQYLRSESPLRVTLSSLTWKSRPVPHARRAAALLIAARMLQGLSIMFGSFVWGSVLVVASVVLAGVYKRIRFPTPLLQPGEASTTANIFLLMISICLVLVMVAWGSAYVVIALKRRARWITRCSYEKLADADPRRPIVLLRSFEDDHVTLPRSWPAPVLPTSDN